LNTQSTLERSTDNAQVLFEKLKSTASSTHGAQNKSGRDFLALQRAMLVAVQRRILEALALRKGYRIGWTAQTHDSEMVEVGLDEENEEEDEENLHTHPMKESTAGLFDHTLFEAISTLQNLRACYERLTEDCLDLYFIAGQGKSFERMLADLAVLKYQSRDFAGAANFFSKIIPIYSKLKWSTLEHEMLIMHAKCLKSLNRRDDYVRILLGILARSASEKANFKAPHSPLSFGRNIESQTIDRRSLIEELFACSSQLPYDISVEMNTYLQNMVVEPYVQHFEDKEGFQLKLRFRSPFQDQFTIEKTTVELVSHSKSLSHRILLVAEEPVIVSKGFCEVDVGCNVSYALYFMSDKSEP
jgi:trafficking protein particle complex subunit 10